MNCDNIQKLTDLYIDGHLPEEMIADFEVHIATCTSCTSDVNSLIQTDALLRASVPPAEVSPAFLERTTAKLYDIFAERLHSSVPKEFDRQWTLPFLYDDEPVSSGN